MFGLFKKGPQKQIDKLQKQYEKLMEQGMHRQRNGDIEGYANLSAEADKVLQEINKLKEEKNNTDS